MRSALKIAGGIVIGFLALIGLCALCALAFTLGTVYVGTLVISQNTPTPSFSGIIPTGIPSGTATPGKAGEVMGWAFRRDDLLIMPLEYRFTGDYRTRWGDVKQPPEGAKFLWVRIAVENTGEHAAETPSSSDFLIRYKEKDIRADLPLSEEPPAMPAYKSETIYPGVRREGWLRFTVPARAQPEDLLLVFRPLLSFRDEAVWRLTP
jgi:hypothetical protein